MQKKIKKQFSYIFLTQKAILIHFLQELNPIRDINMLDFFKKFKWHFFILVSLVSLTFVSEFISRIKKNSHKVIGSVDTLIPKGFVLLPIHIVNGQDIINLVGHHAVVDLYAFSDSSKLPKKQAASAVRVLPPKTEEARWTVLIPENKASYFFGYSNPFYAVIQNPNKNNPQIFKNKIKKKLIVIEENF